MMKVYLLQHEHDLDGADEVKPIGVYPSRGAAEEARLRAEQRPGFRDHPDGFTIDEYELGRDGWTSGFETVGADGLARGRPGKAA